MTSTNSFFRAYVQCALWSSTDNADESGGEPLDRNYSASDLAPETIKQMEKDCNDFQIMNSALLDISGLDDEQQGYDFWLSRNGHGAGFFDRGNTESERKICQQLQEAARVYGSVDLYVGDDGQIHGS